MKNPLDKKSQQETNALLDHTWKELELKFKAVGSISATNGFGLRWQEKLIQSDRRQERTRRLWVLAANSLAVLLFLVVSGFGIWSLLQQAEVSSVLTTALMAFTAFSQEIVDGALSLIGEAPLAAWVFFSAIFASWALSRGDAWQRR